MCNYYIRPKHASMNHACDIKIDWITETEISINCMLFYLNIINLICKASRIFIQDKTTEVINACHSMKLTC
jgi:hypothetical protein